MTDERAIRILALHSVIGGQDPDFALREKVRWYSRTFHTPLHVVQAEVPLVDVLRHYWEAYYAELHQADDEQSRQHLADETRFLTMTPEELEEARRQEDEADTDAVRALARMAEEEAAAAPKGVAPAPAPAQEETFDFGLADLESDPIGLLDDGPPQSLGS